MKQAKVDWSVLRGALGLFGIAVLASAILLAGSFMFRDEMRTLYRNSDSRFKTISRRYLDVDHEERLIRNYYPRFVDLYKAGIIGHERRLDWVEALQKADADTKMPRLGYDIKMREAFTPAFSVKTGPYQIYDSTMTLKLGLLHEGDLAQLLDDLNHYTSGLYSVSECSFHRSGPKVEMDLKKANIDAECALHWFTINFAGDREIAL